MDTRQYRTEYLNESTTTDEASLESMLKVLFQVANKHLPMARDYEYKLFSRAILWVKTSEGKNHLLVTASMHVDVRPYHAEELLLRALYTLYKNDFRVMSPDDKGKITANIHRLFLDVHPCDGHRYDGHDCEKFFTEDGRFLKINGKAQLIRFGRGITYWNSSLPDKSQKIQARSGDFLHDQLLLGIDFDKQDPYLTQWDKCYIIDPTCVLDNCFVVPKEIDLKDIFPELKNVRPQAVLPAENTPTEKLFSMIMDPTSIIKTNLSHGTITYLQSLHQSKNTRELENLKMLIEKNGNVSEGLFKYGLSNRSCSILNELKQCVQLIGKNKGSESTTTLTTTQSLSTSSYSFTQQLNPERVTKQDTNLPCLTSTTMIVGSTPTYQRSQNMSDFVNAGNKRKRVEDHKRPQFFKIKKANEQDPVSFSGTVHDQPRSGYVLRINTTNSNIHSHLQSNFAHIAHNNGVSCCYYSGKVGQGFYLCKDKETVERVQSALNESLGPDSIDLKKYIIKSSTVIVRHLNAQDYKNLLGFVRNHFHPRLIDQHYYSDEKAIFIFDTNKTANIVIKQFQKMQHKKMATATNKKRV